MKIPLLDRLTHQCRIVETGNDSLCFKDSATTPKTKKEKLPLHGSSLATLGHTFNTGQFSVTETAHGYGVK
jgi:hypothetical protein